MQDFDGYSPEMLVFYKALPPQLQNAVRMAEEEPEDLDELTKLALELARREGGRHTS